VNFQLVSGDDLALLLQTSTITRRVSGALDAFEATDVAPWNALALS